MLLRAIVLLAALIGCQNHSTGQHDCDRGDEAACSMLDILLTYAGEGGATKVRPASIDQAERDADAIMNGMQRARSSQQAKQTGIEPAAIHNP